MKIGLTDTMIITGLTVTDTLFLFFADTDTFFLFFTDTVTNHGHALYNGGNR